MAKAQTSIDTIESNPLMTFMVLGAVFETNWDDIPFDNRVAMVRNRVKHKLGNEAYSGAISDVAEEAGLTEGMSKEERSETLKAFRESDPERWSEAMIARATKLWDQIINGVVSENDAPRGDSVQTEYFKLVDKAVVVIFKGIKDQNGKAFKIPTNDTDVITFADGDTWSREELRDFVIDSQGEDLMAQAIAVVENRKVKAPAKPQAAQVTSAAALGLVKKKAA